MYLSYIFEGNYLLDNYDLCFGFIKLFNMTEVSACLKESLILRYTVDVSIDNCICIDGWRISDTLNCHQKSLL